LVRGVRAGYGGRTVLTDVSIDLAEGEIVALLGTNGAGKSTLLKAISGVVEADRGAVIFDGRDITHMPANEVASLGITQMPGGQSTFGSLTIAEHLRLAGWMCRDEVELARRIERVHELFPMLRERAGEPAGDLSGGQQQMLALGMALIAKPRVLLIDELSLGLAPAVVGQLLPVVQELATQGVAVVLVEQSVNVALDVATRAYFMERGMIRFAGPTAELLGRDDLLRSVFLRGAAGGGPDATAVRPSVVDGDAVLDVVGVSASFGGVRAVNNVSLRVGASQIVGLIGPNGAGKTTLFDVVSGFTPITSGRLLLHGVDVSGWSPARRAGAGLGRSFQDARLFPEMTVVETLAVSLERWIEHRAATAAALYWPTVYDEERRTGERVAELIEIMGLGDHRHSFVRELSTGTRRIVDLACLVAHRPAVILLDEPSSGIAQREVESLAPVLVRLRDEMGASLLVIEHDIPLVSSIADRLVALDQGSVIAEGPPAVVLDHPDVLESYLGNSAVARQRSGTRG
jgi:branched-chain amino acid transport system ATP-binding protein